MIIHVYYIEATLAGEEKLRVQYMENTHWNCIYGCCQVESGRFNHSLQSIDSTLWITPDCRQRWIFVNELSLPSNWSVAEWSQKRHSRKPGIIALPLADHLCRAGEWAQSNCTIIAIDFSSRYCVSRGKSANTRPNLKIDTQLGESQYNDQFLS